jgi:hypothetical protein
MNLQILSLTGPNCITIEDGQIVYEKIFPELKTGNLVQLDFKGVRLFASPFFNAAIGQLYRDFSSDELNRLLEMRELTANGEIVLRKVGENAKVYYSSAKAKSIIGSVVDGQEKEDSR